LPGVFVRGETDGPVADVTINEAYEGLGDTYAFFAELFGRKSIDGRGMRLDATVHYQEEPNEGYDNAFWNGRQMVFGDGDRVVFQSFTKSLDVIAHELTHGVTQFESALEYHDQPGALNESFSDVFGSMVKQWKLKQTVADADWLIGRDLLVDQSNNKALRSLKAPGTAYKNDPYLGDDPQPDRMSRFLQLANNMWGDWGGVHINSGIPNRAFYLACVNLGAKCSWEMAGKIWYAALRALHPTSDFIDAANSTVGFAEQMFGANGRKAVSDAWEQVEVLRAEQIAIPKAI
jgi:Zn-dependent metalloprotease